MVVRDHPALSLSRQCRLLSIGRSSLYYEPKGESAETLAPMRRIDELFLKYPFYGARRMALHLRREGVRIGRRRAGRLMRLMGLQAIYRAPRTRRAPTPSTGSGPICCGALRSSGRTMSGAPTSLISRCSAASFTSWRSWTGRAGTSWPGGCRTRWDASFCTDALEEALARHGAPEIFNTDQGSQFTSFAFTGRLQADGIRISMDGRGRCMDNIFIEAAVAFAQIRGGLPARDRRRLRRPVPDPRMGPFLQCREAALGAGRANPGRGIPRRAACGYDGQAAPRLAHIPTGATATTGRSIERGFWAA